MKTNSEINCDLMIIGSGMAGMAAALFAAQWQIKTVQAGLIGELGFASGLLDLLGVHPVAEGLIVQDPWQGIASLCRDEPLHPYARLDITSIRQSMQLFLSFLEKSGYPYYADPRANLQVVTAAGTIKPTYAVPHTMRHGASALAARKPCLLVDFKGLKGFSAGQIASSLAERWPGLQPVRVDFPDITGELYTERMAHALDTAGNRKKLITAVKPHLGETEAVALPAVLGLHHTVQAMDELTQGWGVPVFEIPTMLPAVTGLRLREIFEQRLPAMGIHAFFQQSVLRVHHLAGAGRWLLDVGRTSVEHRVRARAVILCSGRFFGKGLHAGRHAIRETVFDLPVFQPPDRASWHHKEFLHNQGHPINRAGVAVDEQLRPVDAQGRTIYSNLFAAGSILAHQDWMRQKCGSGLAIASAYGAVNACKALLT